MNKCSLYFNFLRKKNNNLLLPVINNLHSASQFKTKPSAWYRSSLIKTTEAWSPRIVILSGDKSPQYGPSDKKDTSKEMMKKSQLKVT